MTLSLALLDEIRALPGVQAASASVPGVFSRSTWQGTIRSTEGDHRDQLLVHETSATPRFFATFGIPVLRGRDFEAGDDRRAAPVVILGETAARQFFHGVDPIGQHLDVNGAATPVEVVGIAKDIRLRNVLAPPPPLIYSPLLQDYRGGDVANAITFEIRSTLPTDAISQALVHLATHGRARATAEVRTVEDAIAETVVLQRLAAWLSGLFGLLGLAMAAVGLYGLLSHLVLKRTAEIGIRLALGAESRKLRHEVWREAMQPVVAGILGGLLIAAAATRLLSSYIFGLTALDPVALGVAVATLLVVAGVACYLPAYRASRIDPLQALRAE